MPETSFSFLIINTCFYLRANPAVLDDNVLLPDQFTPKQFEEPEQITQTFLHRAEQDINVRAKGTQLRYGQGLQGDEGGDQKGAVRHAHGNAGMQPN